MKKQKDYPITGKLRIENSRVFVGDVEIPVYVDIVEKGMNTKNDVKVFDAYDPDKGMIYEFTRKWFGRYRIERYQYH